MDAETWVVIASALIPGVIVFLIALVAIYWVVRKAIRDELRKTK